jgi:plastocyanin
MRTRAQWMLVVAIAWMTGSAEGGVIRGVLRVPASSNRATGSVNAYPGQAGSLSAKALVRGTVGDAVLSIEQIPATAESVLARMPVSREPQLAQQGQAFVPRVLAIAVGTVVDFPNRDPIFHNVFSVSPVKRFDLGKYPRGQSRRVTFSKPGLVQVYCDIHANMAAYIVVLPNHAIARPDDVGAFAFPDLPPGEYLIKVWHPDLPELKRKVEVREGKKDVRVELSWVPSSADASPGR